MKQVNRIGNRFNEMSKKSHDMTLYLIQRNLTTIQYYVSLYYSFSYYFTISRVTLGWASFGLE